MLSSTLNITCSVEATEFNRVAVFLSGQSMAGIIAAIANIMTISLVLSRRFSASLREP